jgi:hypothetical protein
MDEFEENDAAEFMAPEAASDEDVWESDVEDGTCVFES